MGTEIKLKKLAKISQKTEKKYEALYFFVGGIPVGDPIFPPKAILDLCPDDILIKSAKDDDPSYDIVEDVDIAQTVTPIVTTKKLG